MKKKQSKHDILEKVFTPNMRILDQELNNQDFFEILLNILPNEQAEHQLRLLRALSDYSTFLNSELKELDNSISDMFFKKDSIYQVTCIPSHLLTQKLINSHEMIKYVILNNISQLPEIINALSSLNNLNIPYNMSLIDSSDSDENIENIETYLNEIGDLVAISRLEEIIKYSNQRHDLITKLISKTRGSELIIRIRFIAAINDLIYNDNNKDKKKYMGERIRDLFSDKKGMFYINSIVIIQSIKTENWENARLTCLWELTRNKEITKILNDLYPTNRHNSIPVFFN